MGTHSHAHQDPKSASKRPIMISNGRDHTISNHRYHMSWATHDVEMRVVLWYCSGWVAFSQPESQVNQSPKRKVSMQRFPQMYIASLEMCIEVSKVRSILC